MQSRPSGGANLFIQASLRAENDVTANNRDKVIESVISMLLRTLESLRRFAYVALVASLAVCVLNISDAAGLYWIHYTIDGPVSDVTRAKLRELFIDLSDGLLPADRATLEVKEIRVGDHYFVFIKGGRNCSTDTLCLTVVFDQNDSSKIAFLMSNGTFAVPDLSAGGVPHF